MAAYRSVHCDVHADDAGECEDSRDHELRNDDSRTDGHEICRTREQRRLYTPSAKRDNHTKRIEREGDAVATVYSMLWHSIETDSPPGESVYSPVRVSCHAHIKSYIF